MGLSRDQAFPSKYLRKTDLGQPLQVIIANVYTEEVNNDNGGKDTKCVVTFTDTNIKPIILNKTNWLTIESIHGPDTDGWNGKVMELFNDMTVLYKGELGGIRVRAVAASAQAPAAVPAQPGFAPPADLLTRNQGLQLAADNNIGQDALIERLKAAGLTSWGANPSLATSTVQQMIHEKNAQPAVAAMHDDDIPF